MTINGLSVTTHAQQRFEERVALGEGATLADVVRTARLRPTPRHWMRRSVRPNPGLRFGYSALAPGVCLLIRDRAVVTVLTRGLCRQRNDEGGADPRAGISTPALLWATQSAQRSKGEHAMAVLINDGHVAGDGGKPWKHLDYLCPLLAQRAERGFPVLRRDNVDHKKPFQLHERRRCPVCFKEGGMLEGIPDPDWLARAEELQVETAASAWVYDLRHPTEKITQVGMATNLYRRLPRASKRPVPPGSVRRTAFRGTTTCSPPIRMPS